MTKTTKIVDVYLFFCLTITSICAIIHVDDLKDINIEKSEILQSKTNHYDDSELSVYEISMKSCCMVSAAEGVGTGFVYGEDQEYIYAITAAHVVNAYGNQIGTNAYLTFYSKGKHTRSWLPAYEFEPSSYIKGEIVWITDKSSSNILKDNIYLDLAIIKVLKKDFDQYPLPLVAQFSDTESYYARNIITTGCEAGLHPTTLYGYVRDVWDGRFAITPASSSGRSGSAVFDVETKRIIGIILRHDGVANVQTIYEAAKWGSSNISKMSK